MARQKKQLPFLVREQRLLRYARIDEEGNPYVDTTTVILSMGSWYQQEDLEWLRAELTSALSRLDSLTDLGITNVTVEAVDESWCCCPDRNYCACTPEMAYHAKGRRQLTPDEQKIWNDIQIKQRENEKRAAHGASN